MNKGEDGRGQADSPTETDRYEDAPHPRETLSLVGHEEAEQALLEAHRDGRLPQAIILGGQAGIGKATLAWRLARFVLAYPNPTSPAVQKATSLDVPADHPVTHRLSALSHGDVFLLRREWNEKTKRPFTEIRADDVRQAIHLFQQAAGAGGYRVCIVDSAEDLNRSGANALLKLIEEPPPRSLFLIVAHRPGRVMATLRSRCRLMLLKPLGAAEIAAIVKSLGSPWSEHDLGEIQVAAARAHGSVPGALRLLGERGLELDRDITRLLADLPTIDWRAVHEFADQIAGREGTADYEMFLAAIVDWIDERLRSEAGRGARRLAPLAEVWEKAAEAARETEVLNLDRRPFILSLFAELATAAKAFAA
ncbi:MAG: DNA polymerase III subunit delta' [Methylovirgula sp.]